MYTFGMIHQVYRSDIHLPRTWVSPFLTVSWNCMKLLSLPLSSFDKFDSLTKSTESIPSVCFRTGRQWTFVFFILLNIPKFKMGLQDCGIILENPWNTYYAGETVKGKVQLFLTSPKVIRGMCHA